MNSNDFSPCPERKKLIAFGADGSQKVQFNCGEVQSKHVHKAVTPEICTACPLREQLVQIAKRTHPTPKALRSGNIKPAIVSPGFAKCVHRVQGSQTTCCGGTVVKWACQNNACPHYSQEVYPDVCNDCKWRE